MQGKFTIRKLTPTECWKLQGFNSEDCEKARNVGVSDTNLYKQAGNGIVTNCVELLFEHLYKAQVDDTYICTDENFTIGENTNNICKLGNIYPSGGQNGNIYSETGISPTISSGTTNTKGNGGVGSNNAPKVLVNENFTQPQQK